MTPASNSKSRPSPTSKPAPAKDKIIKGKFQVLVISKQIHFKDRSGVVYAISGLGKKDMSKLLKMDKKYISAEIKVPAKSKSKKKTAVFIRFL